MKTQYLEKVGKRSGIKAQVAGRKREKRGQKLAQDLRVDIIISTLDGNPPEKGGKPPDGFHL